jgi:predicted esterase
MTQAVFLLIKDVAPGGIIGFSGIEAFDPALVDVDIALKKKTSMMLHHGYYDPILPLTLAELTYEYYKENSFNYTLTVEPYLAHSVSDFGREKMRAFLAERMEG